MTASRRGWIGRAIVQSPLLIFALMLIWGSIWLQLSQEHIATERDAIKETSNLALAFEENVIRSITAIDQVLLFVRDSYARDPARFDLRSWARDRPFINDQTFQISLVDSSGMLIQSNLSQGAPPVDLSDREHFRVHVGAKQDMLFISKPLMGRVSGRYSVQFTRGIAGPDGEFLGVVVASLDPHYLARFYDTLEIGHGFVMLVGLDGYVRAGRPLPELIGKPLANSPLLERAAQDDHGNYQVAVAAMTGRPAFVSYRRLADYPLAVSVGYGSEEVFALYRLHRFQYVVAGFSLSMLVLCVGALMASHRRRLARYQDALTATLENMSQGIIMVDADRRVAVVNRRVGELLGLPTQLMRETASFDAIVDWQVEHGEFAPEYPVTASIDDLLERGGLDASVPVYERVRPNGTVLEIRTALLPNGGAVRTYTDITERKHNEQALAAARDAAESAGRARAQFLAVMSHEIHTAERHHRRRWAAARSQAGSGRSPLCADHPPIGRPSAAACQRHPGFLPARCLVHGTGGGGIRPACGARRFGGYVRRRGTRERTRPCIDDLRGDSGARHRRSGSATAGAAQFDRQCRQVHRAWQCARDGQVP